VNRLIDYDKLDEELKRLEQEHEEYRRERVAKGLPPDPPEPFVPVAVALLLCQRVEPVFRFVAKYAKLTLDSRQLLPVDVSQFDKYRRDLILLRHSKGFTTGFWGVGLLKCIELMDRVTTAVNKGETETLDPFLVAKDIYAWIQLMGDKVPVMDSTFDSMSALDYREEEKERAETRAELERLRTDEAVFEAEVDALWQHYESIKHLF
jgi:hypothetical protein